MAEVADQICYCPLILLVTNAQIYARPSETTWNRCLFELPWVHTWCTHLVHTLGAHNRFGAWCCAAVLQQPHHGSSARDVSGVTQRLKPSGSSWCFALARGTSTSSPSPETSSATHPMKGKWDFWGRYLFIYDAITAGGCCYQNIGWTVRLQPAHAICDVQVLRQFKPEIEKTFLTLFTNAAMSTAIASFWLHHIITGKNKLWKA